MKINTETLLTTLEGEPVKEAGKEVTVGKIIRNALLSNDEKDKADDKLKKYHLAQSCLASEVDLKAEDVVLIKKQVGNNYPPLVVGQVFDLIDPQ